MSSGKWISVTAKTKMLYKYVDAIHQVNAILSSSSTLMPSVYVFILQLEFMFSCPKYLSTLTMKSGRRRSCDPPLDLQGDDVVLRFSCLFDG